MNARLFGRITVTRLRLMAKMSGKEPVVYGALLLMAGGGDTCAPEVRKVMDLTGLTERQVTHALRGLRGVIRCETVPGKPSLWNVEPPTDSVSDHPQIPESVPPTHFDGTPHTFGTTPPTHSVTADGVHMRAAFDLEAEKSREKQSASAIPALQVARPRPTGQRPKKPNVEHLPTLPGVPPPEDWAARWWAFYQAHGGGPRSQLETWRQEILTRRTKHGDEAMLNSVRGAAADPWANGSQQATADDPPIRGPAWMLRDEQIRKYSDKWLNRGVPPSHAVAHALPPSRTQGENMPGLTAEQWAAGKGPRIAMPTPEKLKPSPPSAETLAMMAAHFPTAVKSS